MPAFCIVNLLQFRHIHYALGRLTGDALLAAADARLAGLLPAPPACLARSDSRVLGLEVTPSSLLHNRQDSSS